MAFSRNSADEAVEQIALNERSHLHQLAINSSRLQENAMINNEEMTDPTPNNIAREDSRSNLRIGDDQPPIRGATMGGKWGSTFWKDYQPARTSHGPSESGEESKSGSEYKGSEVEEESDGVEDRMESENDDMTHKDMTGKGHQTVPADEMLSDEYYEQDGDDPPNESRNHYRTVNHSSGYSSKPPPRPAAPRGILRKSKGSKTNKYSDEDADYEDDDDDEDGRLTSISII